MYPGSNPGEASSIFAAWIGAVTTVQSTTVDMETLRRRMVDNQLRPADVTDHRLLAAFLDIPRERFLPEGLGALAYAEATPLVGDAVSPATLARLVQALELAPSDRVLDAGIDGGYSAAILSRLAGEVVVLAPTAEAAGQLGRRFAELGLANVRPTEGAIDSPPGEDRSFDAVLCAALVGRPEDLPFRLLRDRGRLATIVEGDGTSTSRLFRQEGGTLAERRLFDAWAPPLPSLQKRHSFAFI